jgi:hypothetical protein
VPQWLLVSAIIESNSHQIDGSLSSGSELGIVMPEVGFHIPRLGHFAGRADVHIFFEYPYIFFTCMIVVLVDLTTVLS